MKDYYLALSLRYGKGNLNGFYYYIDGSNFNQNIVSFKDATLLTYKQAKDIGDSMLNYDFAILHKIIFE